MSEAATYQRIGVAFIRAVCKAQAEAGIPGGVWHEEGMIRDAERAARLLFEPSSPMGPLVDHLICVVCQAEGLNAADFNGCCHHGERCDRCHAKEPPGDGQS